MKKRLIEESPSEQRASKPPVTGYRGFGKRVPAPADAHRDEMTDPLLMVLSNAAFDAFAESLDRPSAPSNSARQAVAHARLWKR